MTFLLPCPNCGARPVDEYSFGGEFQARPAPPATDAAWAHYLYARKNVAGPQTEWWYHRLGCSRWFLADRDTRNNEVLRSYWRRPGTMEPVQGAKRLDPFAR